MSGEEAAFRELIEKEGGRLLMASRRILGNEEDARDCVQETFAKVHSKLEAFEGRSSLGTWIYKILINESLMKLRRRRGRKTVDIESLMPEFDSDDCRVEPLWQPERDTEELAVEAETRKFVRDAIDSLPDDARIVLLLRDIEELSTREAAEILGITEVVLKGRLHRARAALKKLLEPVYRRGSS